MLHNSGSSGSTTDSTKCCFFAVPKQTRMVRGQTMHHSAAYSSQVGRANYSCGGLRSGVDTRKRQTKNLLLLGELIPQQTRCVVTQIVDIFLHHQPDFGPRHFKHLATRARPLRRNVSRFFFTQGHSLVSCGSFSRSMCTFNREMAHNASALFGNGTAEMRGRPVFVARRSWDNFE